MIVSVDGGINGCGAAQFDSDRVLTRAAFAKPIQIPLGCEPISIVERARNAAAGVFTLLHYGEIFCPPTGVLVYEWPQIYRETKQKYRNKAGGVSKRDPNSLLPLAGIGPALLTMLGNGWRSAAYLPAEWKLQIDKEECTRRVRERLTAEEFARVELPKNTCDECRKQIMAEDCTKPGTCKANHIYDAIGIGLKYASRFEPRRIYAR